MHTRHLKGDFCAGWRTMSGMITSSRTKGRKPDGQGKIEHENTQLLGTP